MTGNTRRGFLRLATLVAATSACRGAQAAVCSSAFAPPRLGIQLYSLRGFSRDEALKHASEMGFEQVEFYSGMLALNATDEEISAFAAARGIKPLIPKGRWEGRDLEQTIFPFHCLEDDDDAEAGSERFIHEGGSDVTSDA